MQFHHPNRVKNYTFAAQQRAFPPPPLLANSRWRGGNARSLQNICVPHHLYWQTADGGGDTQITTSPSSDLCFPPPLPPGGENPNLYSSNSRFPPPPLRANSQGGVGNASSTTTLASPPGTATAQGPSSAAGPLGRSQRGPPMGLMALGCACGPLGPRLRRTQGERSCGS